MIRSAVRAGSPAAARDRGRCPVPEDEVGMGRNGNRTGRAGARSARVRQDRGMARAQANGLELEYDPFGDPANPALLLVMGLGAQMITWEDGFCALLAGRGFFVVRYDNRDVGLSPWLDHLPPPDLAALAAGDRSSAPYRLSDMAD